MSKYTIGIDYGSLSGRAVLVRCDSGEVVAESTMDYPHAVMDAALSDGTPLGQDWALQDPQDYLDVLDTVIPAVLRESGVAAEDVIGVGTDFTACTVLPVKADGTPLCFLPQFRSTPNAYVKLWKHHAAEKYAARVTEIAGRAVPAALWRQNFQRVGDPEDLADSGRKPGGLRSRRPHCGGRRLDRLAAHRRLAQEHLRRRL